MKYFFLSLSLSVLFIHAASVFAQGVTPTQSTPTSGAQTTSISGGDLCGNSASTICTLDNLKTLFKRIALLVAGVGSMFVIAVIAVRFTYGVMIRIFGNDPSALNRARNDSWNALVGFLIIIAVAGGFLAVGLKIFGAKDWTFGILNLISYGFVEHAYAAQDQFLQNPLQSNSLYDLVVAALNLAIRFFVYPAIIAAWVASGFKFVYSQGSPEGLKTARSWLFATLIATVVIFTIQGFVLALRGTAEKVFQGTGVTEQQTQQTTSLGSSGGTSNTQGLPTGNSSSGSTTQSPQNFCQGKAAGTQCTTTNNRPGRCGYNDEGSVWDCYVVQPLGASCTTSTGAIGSIDISGNCH